MAQNTPFVKPIVVVTYQSLGKNINQDTWEGPKSIELVKRMPTDLEHFLDCQTIFIWFSVPPKQATKFKIVAAN